MGEESNRAAPVSAGALVIAADGTICQVDADWVAELGLEVAAVLGQPLTTVLDVPPSWAVLSDSRPWRGMLRLRVGSPRWRQCRVDLVPVLDQAGRMRCCTLMFESGAVAAAGAAGRAQLLESVVDAASDAIIVARLERLEVIYANRAAHLLFGCDADARDMIGRAGAPFWPRHDLGVLEALLPQALAGGWRGELRQQRLDGTQFLADATIFALPSATGAPELVAAMLRDLSAQQQTTREQRLAHFALEHSGDEVFLLDAEARFVYVNDSMCATLGLARERLLGMAVPDIDPVFPPQQLPEVFARLREESSIRVETVHQRSDGTRFPVEVVSNYFVVDGAEFNCCIGRDITERVAAERALEASREYLDTLIDALPDALFAIDAEGMVTIWNRAIEQMSGIAREAVLGRGARAYAKAFYGESRPMLIDLVFAPAAVAEQIECHYDQVQRDGDVLLTQVHLPGVYGGRGAHVWGKAAPLRDAAGQVFGALEIIRDVSELKEAERALRLSEARFRSVVSNTPVMIFEFDADGVFQLCEGSSLKTLGLVPGALVGTSVAGFFGAESGVVAGIARALGGEAVQFTANLGRQVFETYFNPVRDPGSAAAAVIGVAVDVTERTEREAELRQRTDELTRFTYTVSHDLKSPLVTIRTFLGFLERDLAGGDAARVAKDLDFIRNASERMTRLLDELLELSRIGRLINEPTEFRLHEVIEEVLALVAGRIVERGVEVVVHEAPVWVQGDRPRLTEVFLNLLDNAVKFMGEQPAPRIEIGVEREDEALVVVVADNGKGIDPRHLHKIFGLFERLDREGDGTGIGLTLVQRIVEVHGGRIWAESPGPGLGARFCFTLGALELRPDG
ncbi:PAS domain-containing sensor histidine kinase [Marichromatium bheemlicum]|uniref:histidine kinase n=1 Tax=Marichromatium bheemlicum TaxID=365339 RepID=A0ABX1I3H6_9GAMM|nr:PAS domain S-box protein [Marichromatium bheemlicum]NKN32068.1 PAS domain S-box protein [Marichromatium bheemlicum]